MGLESGTRITDLVITNPTATDVRSAGDDHLRLVKTVLKNDALNVLGTQAKQDITVASGAITPAALSSAIINLTGEGSVADNLDTITATNKYSGNLIMLKGADAANPVTVRDTSVGSGNIQTIRNKSAVLDSTEDYIILWYDGTNWNEITRSDLSEILDGDTWTDLTLTGDLSVGDDLTVTGDVVGDTILERTAAAGVTIDGFKIKDTAPDPSVWPYFRATKDADQTGLDTSYQKVTFVTEVVDNNSNYAAADSKFTPTVGGIYRFDVLLQFMSTLVADAGVYVALYKNGSIFSFRRDINGANPRSIFFSDTIQLNGSGDYVEVYVKSAADASWGIEGHDATYATQWTGHRIA